tara:strand:- start:663 stop:1379 length:717 start_codon:yes stop_codon:yes gene_type:complete
MAVTIRTGSKKEAITRKVLEAARIWYENSDDGLEQLEAKLREAISSEFAHEAKPGVSPKRDHVHFKNVTPDQIFQSISAEQLKLLGTYQDVKGAIEGEMGASLAVTGWTGLYTTLQKLISEGADEIESIARNVPPTQAKAQLKIRYNVVIRAKNKNEAQNAVKKIATFVRRGIKSWDQQANKKLNKATDGKDLFAIYESIKSQNFIDSSRLENMSVSQRDIEQDLESVIKKHKVVQRG